MLSEIVDIRDFSQNVYQNVQIIYLPKQNPTKVIIVKICCYKTFEVCCIL